MSNPELTTSLQEISKKLDELATAYRRLKAENQQLKMNAETWQHERQRLLQQNEMARNKIAEMIGRLRHMEPESND